MDVLTYLVSMRPAIPMSSEKPCAVASNSELRRWIENGSVLINGVNMKYNNEINKVDSLVFFPNSKRRTTVW
jgi:23S rRNA-/tRNA-specific pseudouridylate synthase